MPAPDTTPSLNRPSFAPGWPSAVLFLLLMLASLRFASVDIWHAEFARIESYVLYQAGTLAFNYFQFGAIRRGLGGSMAYLLSRDPEVATILFHCLAAASVSLTACWLFRRLDAPRDTRLVFAAVMLVLMLRWGDDAGRTDMAVAALLGCMTIGFARGRPVPAAACVGVGLFIHESSFVFGVPLLLALVLQAGPGRVTRRQRFGIAGVLAAALLAYVFLDALPHAGRREMVEVVRSRLPIHEHVDWAIYFALGGMRGVRTSICQNLTDPSYWVHPASGLLVIGLVAAVLAGKGRRQLSWVLLAALPGFVFLSIIANDISRWTLFACFNIWLLAIAAPPGDGAPGLPTRLRLVLAALLFPLALYRPGIVEYRIYAPSPLLEGVVRRLGGPRTPSVEEALERCDPHWSDVLYAP